MHEYISRIRSLVGHDMLLLPTTACMILGGDDEILLQHRSDNECWGCPGGIVDTGETVLESLHREVFEETGLEIERPRLFGIYSGPSFEYTYPNGDRTAIVQMVFLVTSFNGIPRHDHESTELRRFPIDRLPEPITPPHARFLHDLRLYLRGELRIPVVR